ncbi:MAG: adenine phosphoribosyltransferase [Phocaeicola sp.]|nr:adenine phosphoribosyltransferase [Phocaeicola sp.]MBR1720038.1 adenine phosphoribosyltransferase [Phocaeicola sp.]
MNKQVLLKNLRTIPDFPIKGILFFDVTTLFKDAECLKIMVDELYEYYKDKGITKVVGIESRGFVLGGALAEKLGAGLIMARKPGKLPAEVVEETYEKEYGKDTIQIHKDALNENDVVLLHDDLLATGGTMAAAERLVEKFGVKKTYVNFIMEITDLNGRNVFPKETDVYSLLSVSEKQ